MRYLRFAAVGLTLCTLCPPSLLAAASSKQLCKKIRDAVWAGKTLEQITAEFDTDAETVMKCTQKKGKRKSKSKSKKKKGTKSKSSKTDSSPSPSSAQKSTSSSPSGRKPAAPRSGPWPAHLP